MLPYLKQTCLAYVCVYISSADCVAEVVTSSVHNYMYLVMALDLYVVGFIHVPVESVRLSDFRNDSACNLGYVLHDCIRSKFIVT